MERMCIFLAVAIGLSAGVHADIAVSKNVPYLANAGYADDKDKLDIYAPGEADNAPVMIFLHGGALLRGDKSGMGKIGTYFSGEGFVTVIPNYRLSPGVMHPAHIEDVAAAFAWVRSHIESYGGDPAAVFVVGHSAGAYLAGLLALDARYLAAHGLDPGDIAGVVPISGFFHVDRVAPARPKSVWGDGVDVWRAASPATYVLRPGVPPMLCLYADGDTPERRQESRGFVDALRHEGHTNAETLEIADRTHITIWSRLGSATDPTTQQVLGFMRGILESR